jgi:hypothetical protein
MEGGKEEPVSERGSEKRNQEKKVMLGPGDMYGPSRCFCNRGGCLAADVMLTGRFQPL